MFLVLIGLYLASVVSDAGWIEALTSLATLVAVLTCWSTSGAVGRVMAVIFLTSGSVMLLWSGEDVTSLLFRFGQMVYIVTLFSLLPVLSIPIRLFHYDQAVSALFRAISVSTTKAYFGILFLSYFIGSFLNLGTVPLVYRTVEHSVEGLGISDYRTFIGISLTQGFIGPLVWTPFSGLLGVTLTVFNTRWLTLLPVLLLIGFLSTLLSIVAYFLLQERHFRKTSTSAFVLTRRSEVTWSMLRPLFELFCIVSSFILAVLAMESIYHAGLVTTIIFATFPFMVIWVALKGGLRQLPAELSSYFRGHFYSMSGTYLVFLTAGFFLAAFEVSGYNVIVGDVTRVAIQNAGTVVFVAVFPLVVIGLAFLAIHPIVFLILISSALSSNVFELSSEGMAVTFLAGGVLNFIISPYSGTVGLLRQMTNHSGRSIIAANMPTAIVTYLTFITVIYIVYL